MYISADRFKDGKFTNPRDPEGKREVREIQDKLESIEKFLIRLCEDNPVEKVTKDFVLARLELFLNPPKKEMVVPEISFFDIFEDYIAKKNISEWRIKHLRVLKRALMRYELYVQANGNRQYRIKLDESTPSLEAQRDIFIFQCLIGCRVSDLMAMTPRSD